MDGDPLIVRNEMPDLDYIIESGNRLWGCRYDAANKINEIYASKLGDFKNWNSFSGLSTDSYAVSCGTDGKWTGAVTYYGYPLFSRKITYTRYTEIIRVIFSFKLQAVAAFRTAARTVLPL